MTFNLLFLFIILLLHVHKLNKVSQFKAVADWNWAVRRNTIREKLFYGQRTHSLILYLLLCVQDLPTKASYDFMMISGSYSYK